MRVIWSPLAVERAYEEARYIAQDKPEAALKWLDGLFKVTDRLARFPKSGRAVPEIGSETFREVVYRSHRVVYRIEASVVSILTVRSFAQQLDHDDLQESTP
ncbi:MAG TPA: type II toxin-antitoxin system RelE/ParE family toxin [Thermoanaerobaculia bacterium]